MVDDEVFTPESHNAYTTRFKPRRVQKTPECVSALIHALSGNPEWQSLEQEAMAAAPTELHGSAEALKSIKPKTEQFGQVGLPRQTHRALHGMEGFFAGWSLEAVRDQIHLLDREQVKQAEATEITDDDWKPKWTEVLVCLGTPLSWSV